MKNKSMIITAITVGYLVRDYVTHYNYVKSNFERNLFTVIIICFTIFIICAYKEVKLHIKSYLNDKKSNLNRQKITYHDCDRKRMIQEFQKQRSEFFESYFKNSLQSQ